MGIPKFYRWLSERFPKINQVVNGSLKPEYDNLYLDMNGIVHHCTHSDGDVKTRATEEDMMTNIFKYIDKLFNMARPKRLIYMAIDGVAPRAKMNQQRQRRFRSAMEAKEAREEAIRNGEPVPDGPVFDSNCITPGTEFMARLSEQVKYFIRKKMREDSQWQKVTVIFSGAEVPGEGEHKIMLYIRAMKMQPGYNPNLRHCLYGLDADLIMLGLVSHDPHFSLLREEVIFGSNRPDFLPRKQMTKLDEFQFLHLSVLREYVDMEFREIAPTLPFGYQLERVLDDWVFLCYLVGNDFLPHLPTLDIAEGGLDTLLATYKQLLPTMGGYLLDKGIISLPRAEMIFKRMGEEESNVFQARIDEEARFAARQRRGGGRGRGAPVREIAHDEDFDEEAEKKELEEKLQAMQDVTLPDGSYSFKLKYYREKYPEFFPRDAVKDMAAIAVPLAELCRTYLQGLSWVAQYYYQGCISWKWYFPYRYAPLASDMVNLSSHDIRMELGEPFRPMEQLLGVLPPGSNLLLPPAYRELMLSPTSPILDYYPPTFKVDMNGKKSSWEGIALIPFIDETRLLSAIANIGGEKGLTATEKLRNARIGDETVITYDADCHDNYPAPAFFSTIKDCNSRSRVWHLPSIPRATTAEGKAEEAKQAALRLVASESKAVAGGESKESERWRNDGGLFIPELSKGLVFPGSGWAYLSSHETDCKLQPIGVNLFGRPSSKDSLLLRLKHQEVGEAAKLAARFVGRRCFVEWPFLREALVSSVTDGILRWSWVRGQPTAKCTPLTKEEALEFTKNARLLQSKVLTSEGLDTGPITVIFSVCLFNGMKRMPDGSIRKSFSKDEKEVPAQMVLPSMKNVDTRFEEKAAPTLADAFPVGSSVVYIGPDYYGSCSKIVAHNGASSVDIEVEVAHPEPSFTRKLATSSTLHWFPSHLICRSLAIRADVLGKITSSLYVNPGNIDIGLKLKFSKSSMCVSDYCRRVDAWRKVPGEGKDDQRSTSPSTQGGQSNGYDGGQWEYSERTIALIAAYKRRFPLLFEALHTTSDSGYALPAESFATAGGKQGAVAAIKEVTDWLTQIGISNLILIPCTSAQVPTRGVKLIDSETARYFALTEETKKGVVRLSGVPLFHLYTPTPRVAWSPSERTEPELGDRVLSLRSDEGPPFGARGTVVGVHGKHVEVVFDEKFISGTTLHARCSNLRGQTCALKSLLNLSKPRVLVPKSASGTSTKVATTVVTAIPTLAAFVSVEPPAEWSTPQFVWDKIVLPPKGSTSQEGKRTHVVADGNDGASSSSSSSYGGGRGNGRGRGRGGFTGGPQTQAAGPVSGSTGFKPRRTGGAGHVPSPSPSPPLPSSSPAPTDAPTPAPVPVVPVTSSGAAQVLELWNQLQANAKKAAPTTATAASSPSTAPVPAATATATGTPPIDVKGTDTLRGMLGIGSAPSPVTAPAPVGQYNQATAPMAMPMYYGGAPVAPLPQHLSYGVTGQTPNYHHLANLYGTDSRDTSSGYTSTGGAPAAAPSASSAAPSGAWTARPAVPVTQPNPNTQPPPPSS